MVTVETNDGGAVPDDTLVCLGSVCKRVGDAVSGAAAFGTRVTFTDLSAGDYRVTATKASPYADWSQEIVIGEGETVAFTITLVRESDLPDAATPITTTTPIPTAAVTVIPATLVPTEPGAPIEPTATDQAGPAPTAATDDGGPSDPNAGSGGTTTGDGGSSPSGGGASGTSGGGAAVTALPKTGSGSDSSDTSLIALLVAAGMILAIWVVTWQRRER